MDAPVAKTVLPNGIRIVTRTMPQTRSVAMGVWVLVGARDESEAESGLSHFIEHMIFKGTRRRSAFQIAKEFDAVGGNTNAFTTMESTCFYAKVMDTHTETMVDILSDIFLNSVFEPAEMEKERQVILQEIRMVEDSPEEYVHNLAGRNFWRNHPLGRSILGTPENVAGFTVEHLKNFFRRLYLPERIVVSVAGSVEHEHIVDLLAPTFGSVAAGDGFPERCAPQGCFSMELNYRRLEQAHICLGTRGLAITDPRRYSFSLLNTILGGNMSSRLFQEVREKRGLAYNVYSYIASHVDTGMFGVYLAVDPQRAPETIGLVLREMRRLRNRPVEPGELQGAREFTKGSLLLASESTDNQMVRIAQNEIHFGRDVPLEEVLEAIEAVSAEDIRQLAAALFDGNRMALTLLGPVKERKQLEGLLLNC